MSIYVSINLNIENRLLGVYLLMYGKTRESSYLNSFTAQSTCYIIRAVSQLAWYLCHSATRQIVRINAGVSETCVQHRILRGRRTEGHRCIYLLRYLFANILAQRTPGQISTVFVRTIYVFSKAQINNLNIDLGRILPFVPKYIFDCLELCYKSPWKLV